MFHPEVIAIYYIGVRLSFEICRETRGLRWGIFICLRIMKVEGGYSLCDILQRTSFSFSLCLGGRCCLTIYILREQARVYTYWANKVCARNMFAYKVNILLKLLFSDARGEQFFKNIRTKFNVAYTYGF